MKPQTDSRNEWIDLDDPDLSQEEYEQLHALDQAPPDQRRVIIRGWDESTKQFRPRFFYEPSHDLLLKAFQAVMPVVSRANLKTVCTCEAAYDELHRAVESLESGVACFAFTGKLPQDADGALTQWAKQEFMSMQDAASALSEAAQDAERASIELLMAEVKAVPLPVNTRKEQIKYLEGRLKRFKTPPETPPISEGASKRCPVCRQKYHYPFWEVLMTNNLVLDRLSSLLLGCHVLPEDLPVMAAALEEWFAEFMTSAPAKKKSFQKSLTGIFLTDLWNRIQEVKADLLGSPMIGTSDLHDTSEDSAIDSEASGNENTPLDN